MEEEDEDRDRFEYRAQIICENASAEVVSSHCFSADSSRVLIATTEREIAVWDCQTDEVADVIDSNDGLVRHALFVQSGGGAIATHTANRLSVLMRRQRAQQQHKRAKKDGTTSELLLALPANESFTPVMLCVVDGNSMLCTISLTTGLVHVFNVVSQDEEAATMTFPSGLPEELLLPAAAAAATEGEEEEEDAPVYHVLAQGNYILFGLQYCDLVTVIDVSTCAARNVDLAALVSDEDTIAACALCQTHLAILTDQGRGMVFSIARLFASSSSVQVKPWISLPRGGGVTCLQLSPNGRSLFVSSGDNSKLCIWSVQARSESHELVKPGVLKKNRSPCAVAEFSPNNLVLAAASDNVVCLWDVASGQYLGALCEAEQQVERMCFSWDSLRLLGLCRDGGGEEEEGGWACTQIVWDLVSGDRERVRIVAMRPELAGLGPCVLRRIESYLF